MATFAHKIAPPSHTEIMAQVVANMPALYVYNPSPYWIKQMAAGLWFYIPPDLGGKEIHHEIWSTEEKPVMVKADGILAIRSIYGKDKTKAPIIGADGVISVLISSRGEMGLCFLPGGAQDVLIKKQAQGVWQQFRIFQAQRELAAWGEKLNKHNLNPATKGAFPPIPSKAVLEAMVFLDEYALGQKDGGYRCKDCGLLTTDQTVWEKHLKASGHMDMQESSKDRAPRLIPIPELTPPAPVSLAGKK